MQKTKLYLNRMIKNNLYQILLLFLLLFAILITNFYSINKKNSEDDLVNFLNNSYLKKSLNLVVNNLTPKFSYIEIGRASCRERV